MNLMNSEDLLVGASFMMGLTITVLIVIPYTEVSDLRPPDKLKPYSEQAQRGREIYLQNECMACHSQQPRSLSQAPDLKRGWGRAPIAADYYYDRPVLLGTMRTGPDLFNIAARQPSVDWHLGHLYQPRAYVKDSIMPSYRFLFVIKSKAEPGDKVVQLPPAWRPASGVVVATPKALDLVAYLLSLDHTYPIDNAPVLPPVASAPATAGQS
ncbi:cytochrome-c oxidase [Silvimonas iriomotensis]|uniref:Cytochrome-c oxidase n=2 Tax=Silvimonas iriomotensis TaxID=449662 RepID=A0ABQ2P6Z6_9NEIS|nr:cytochrome-c oxidase [Silvimonas iriomotensis]